MAGKIKGITIEIGGDTQKLNKALEDVNKKTRDVQSELRQVERLLKLDPKNTELLAQKQKLLADAVENSREKLDRLKAAQEQVNEQFKKGEISEEQYRAFQREVIKAEQELEKFEKQLRETGLTAEQVGKKLQDAGKKMTDMGKNLSMKVTAPNVAAGAASFKMAADLQDAMGATEQIFKGAADSVKTWADNLDSYYGIAEAEALEYANMMGSMLVNIGGLTEEQAAKQAQTLIELAGDLTAMYGGTTADAVRALTGALKGNNTMLDNYGMAVNDAMIKTKALEMGLYDGTGQMDLATKQAATLALIMEQTGAAQGQAAREAEGASGGMRALATEIKNLATDIGEVLLPVITPLISKIKEWVQGFSKMSPETKKVILVIAGIAAAIGPLLIVLGQMSLGLSSIIKLIGPLTTGLAGATGAAGGLSAVIGALTGPIGIAIAAIAALTAGGIALYKHMQKDSIPTVNLFGDTVSEATQQAVGSFMELNEQATLALNQLSWSGQEVTQEMADSITNNFSQMAEQVQAGLDSHYQESLQKMQAFVNNSASLSKEEQEQILANMQQGYENRKQTIEEGEARIKEILQTASEEKRALTKEEQEEINAIQQEMVNTGIQVLSENELEAKVIMERMRQQAGEISARQAAEVVQNSLKQKEEAIKAAEEQCNEVIKEIIRQRDEAGTITAEQADALIKEAIRQKEETILNAEEMHDRIIEEAQAQAGEHIKLIDWETGEVLNKWQVFKKDVGKTWDDIKKKSAETWDGIKQTATDVWNGIKDFFKKWGDELLLIAAGPAGWAVLLRRKIAENWDSIKAKTSEVWENIKTAITRPIESAKQKVLGIIDTIRNAFANLRIEIPRPKLPHVSVNWKSVGVGNTKVSIPDFDLNWYKMGGIFNRPSIIGVGEAGTEAVIPLDKMPGLIADALRDAMGGNQLAMAGGITVQNMYVRNDNDIKLIARELYNLQQTNARGRGLR